MKRHEDSLDAQIADLARLTGAPAEFVAKVRTLFVRRGIPLDSDPEPYRTALEEAFRREETNRLATRQRRRADRSENLGELDHEWQRQLTQLGTIRDSLRREAHRLGNSVFVVSAPASEDPLPMRLGSVELPVVPGPDEVQ